MSNPRRAGSIAAALIAALVVGGCGGPGRISRENDRLREENLGLQRRVERLQQREERLADRVAALEKRLETDPPAMTGVSLVELSGLRIGRYSSAVDADNDGRDDLIRLYVTPVDQEGRMMPVAGRVTVQAVAIQPDRPPRTVVEKTYEPRQWDEAYRSGVTGTHYTLELSLPEELPEVDQLTAKVSFIAARTGLTFEAQKALEIDRTPAGGAAQPQAAPSASRAQRVFLFAEGPAAATTQDFAFSREPTWSRTRPSS